MKKIFSTPIINGSMGEISELEYIEGWDGNVEGYFFNLDVQEGRWMEVGIPGNIRQNFGGLNDVDEIHTVFYGDEPTEVWFAATE